MPTKASKRGFVRVINMKKVVIMSKVRVPCITFIALLFRIEDSSNLHWPLQIKLYDGQQGQAKEVSKELLWWKRSS